MHQRTLNVDATRAGPVTGNPIHFTRSSIVNSIKSFIRNLFISNKKKELHNAVDAYTEVAHFAASAGVGAYRAAAHDIIDLTFENPEVALNLINAAKAAVELYSPIFDRMSRGIDASFSTTTAKELIATFEAAIKQLDNKPAE